MYLVINYTEPDIFPKQLEPQMINLINYLKC